ncbi:transcriptional adapter 1-like [Ornithodoros turicata]|uniref:transcriptional adapter 1-like n=1 Tax=Ornithodoros turicata TaxID=34597 RepID=UPI0031386889
MAASMSQLVQAKQRIAEALGDKFKAYLNALKLWFNHKLTKDEFDIEARKILSSDAIHIHNEFLLALFNKCQSACNTQSRETPSAVSSHIREKLRKGKLKAKTRPVRITFEKRFVPAQSTKHIPHAVAREVPDSGQKLSFCSREHTLPDALMVNGRMFVIAWDSGLDAVDDAAVQLVMTAVQMQVKNILMALFSRRNAYKIREGRFQYAVGCAPPNPYLQNSKNVSNFTSQSHATWVSATGEHVPYIVPTVDWAESEAALEAACDPVPRPRLPPASPFDLVEALKVHKGIIPSHTVYAKNMERALATLWHPSHEELEQEDIHSQEEAIKRKLIAEQQAVMW